MRAGGGRASPFRLWARRELAKAGIRDDDRAATIAASAFLPVLPVIHVLAHRLPHRRRRPRRPRAAGARSRPLLRFRARY